MIRSRNVSNMNFKSSFKSPQSWVTGKRRYRERLGWQYPLLCPAQSLRFTPFDPFISTAQPPETGQITATSSPPRRKIVSGSSTISSLTAQLLCASTASSVVFGWRAERRAANADNGKCWGVDDVDSDAGRVGRGIRSIVRPVAVEAPAK